MIDLFQLNKYLAIDSKFLADLSLTIIFISLPITSHKWNRDFILSNEPKSVIDAKKKLSQIQSDSSWTGKQHRYRGSRLQVR